MKIELVYLWINEDRNNCFHQEEFNFSPRYSISFTREKNELQIQKIHRTNVFEDGNITNVTAIIGENGTGKTTLLNFITSLCDLPLEKEQRDEYVEYVEHENAIREFVAVYVQSNNGSETEHIVNITQNTIICGNQLVPPRTNGLPESYLCEMSRVYLSNATINNMPNQNLRQEFIDHITIADNTLSTIYYEFYRQKYAIGSNMIVTNKPFEKLERNLMQQENHISMQKIIDLSFYAYAKSNNKSFCGKHIKNISFSLKDARGRMQKATQEHNFTFIKSNKDMVEEADKRYSEIHRSIYNKRDAWSVIVCNLVWELLFVYNEFNPYESQQAPCDVDTAFEKCKIFVCSINDIEEQRYYKDAIHEIEILKTIIKRAAVSDNRLPCADGGYKVFWETDIVNFVPLIAHIKKGYSFVIKYLDIRNFEISSGERALLNLMSRLYFSSQIGEYLPNSGFMWKENILLLIDEIDAYLHPEWQRQIIYDLISTIHDLFPKNYFQIIFTSHSPIVLSDIPRENSIFLKIDANNRIVQVKRGEQTFGANIYSLYKDAFFLNNGTAMGKFAQEKINRWISDMLNGNINDANVEDILMLIGEPVIKTRLERIVQNKNLSIETAKMRYDEKQNVIEFLRKQKRSIEYQIAKLEGDAR